MSDNNENINLNESADAEISNKQSEKVAPIPGMLVEGTTVKIKKTVLHGKVEGYHLSKDKKTFSYLVSYTEDGENHERAFTHDQIEEIKEEQ